MAAAASLAAELLYIAADLAETNRPAAALVQSAATLVAQSQVRRPTNPNIDARHYSRIHTSISRDWHAPEGRDARRSGP
jgi:hypothetical protein